MAAGHVSYVGGMFASVIELSPGSTLIELPVITRRPRMISVCRPERGGRDYPLSWMSRSETVIEMDFCLLLSHSDRLLEISASPRAEVLLEMLEWRL